MTDHKQWEQDMSSEFGTMMDGIRSEPIPEDALQRSLEAAEAIVMTEAAAARGRKNGIATMIVMYPVVAAIGLAISTWFDISLMLVVVGLFIGLFAISFVVLIVSQAGGQTSAGNVLLECGPHPAAKMSRKASVVVFLMAGGFTVFSVFWATNLFGIVFSAFLFGFALFWLFLSKGRLKICENGIFLYYSLLRWDRIKNYHWEGTDDATLMLQSKARLTFLSHSAVPVAIEQKAAVDALLKQHLG